MCGADPIMGLELCSHHHTVYDDWAVVNRIANDFFMRGVEPPPVPDIVIGAEPAIAY